MYGGATEHAQRMYDNSHITLVKHGQPNERHRDTRGHNDRHRHLSASIQVILNEKPRTEYVGQYLNHGKSKTVFLRKRCDDTGLFHGHVLKVARQHDLEPSVFKRLRDMTLGVLYSCVAREVL